MELDTDERDQQTTDHGPDKTAIRAAGAVGAASALILLWGLSKVWDGAPFAPQAIAERFLRLTPGDVATFFIETFGHWARRLLTIAALVLTVVFGGEALVRTRRGGVLRPYATGLLLASIALVASLSSPSVSASVIQTAIASALAIPLYARVSRSMAGALSHDIEGDASRRRALRVGLIATVGLGAGGALVRAIAGRFSGPDTDVALVAPSVPVSAPRTEGFPDIAGLSPEVTSAAEHYVVDINLVQPSVDASSWKLSVAGEVETASTYSFDGLQNTFEVIEEYVTLTCISNEVGGDLIGNSAWGGVRLADVLEAASPKPGSMDVVFRAADGYSDSIPLEVAMDGSVIIAVSQNGQPLHQEHGFPCRVRIPGIYGMKNVKWLEAIEVVSSDYLGYWQKRGWSDPAVIKTQSRMDVVGENGSARSGLSTWVAGVAWAGDRGISAVEVSVDRGETWSKATLKEPLSPFAWTLWAYRWIPEGAGTTTVMCRATDGSGETQTASPAAPHPDGAAGYHTVSVVVA